MASLSTRVVFIRDCLRGPGVRRPGSSPHGGFTVAGQHRDPTGFAASMAPDASDGPGDVSRARHWRALRRRAQPWSAGRSSRVTVNVTSPPSRTTTTSTVVPGRWDLTCAARSSMP